MQIEIVNEVNQENWLSFVINHTYSNPFQMPWMYDFFENVNGYNPYKIFALDEYKNIKGCLIAVIQQEGSGIKGKFSTRAIISGGPLVDEKFEESFNIFKLLIDKFISVVKKNTIYIEFRNFFKLNELHFRYLQQKKFFFEDHLNFIISLKDSVHPFNKISESKRRQVKKAIQNGSEIIIADNLNQIKEFYTLLINVYKYRAKKPLADWSFFKNFYEINCAKGQGIYILIRKETKIIGGIMCIIHKQIIYEWYVCGLDFEFKKNFPSVLATWAAIEHGYKNNFSFFDFLGAGNPNEKYGVRDFKSKFGGDTVNYGRFVRINKPIIFKLGKTLVSIYSRFLS